MATEFDCNESALARSRCIIQAILDDLIETYPLSGGGGISSIRQDATWVYTVAISQEGRKDLITYRVSLSPAGRVVIEERSVATKNHGH